MPQIPTGALSTSFRAFYADMTRLRQRITAVHPGAAAAMPAAAGDKALAAALDTERQPLVAFLHKLEADGRKLGPAQAGIYHQAQYLLAAWADEVFTHLDWPLAAAWEKNSLEALLFQTHDAGTAVFQRIDRLLEVAAPAQRGLAKLYLMVLDLGFRGKYREVPSDGAIDAYRSRLESFAWPEPAAPPRPVIFPEAYRHTRGGSAGRLPSLKRWLALALLTLLAVVVISFPLWRIASRPIAELVARILAQ